MAVRHCSMKRGKAGKGASHADYVAGEGRYAAKGGVLTVIDGNLPAWAETARDFFAAADQFERANGRAYTEIEFSIPREAADPVGYARQFAATMLGAHHPFRLGVHDVPAADGGRNVHAHLMFTERKLDGIERGAEQFFRRANSKAPELGGAAKDREWNARAAVQRVRDAYQAHAAERGVVIDMRSNAAQGLDLAEPKIGPKARSRKRSEAVAEVNEIRVDREIVRQTEAELMALRAALEAEQEKKKQEAKLPDVAAYLSAQNGLKEATPGQPLAGKILDQVQLAEGHFTVIDAGRGQAWLVSGAVGQKGQIVTGINRPDGLKIKSGKGFER